MEIYKCLLQYMIIVQATLCMMSSTAYSLQCNHVLGIFLSPSHHPQVIGRSRGIVHGSKGMDISRAGETSIQIDAIHDTNLLGMFHVGQRLEYIDHSISALSNPFRKDRKNVYLIPGSHPHIGHFYVIHDTDIRVQSLVQELAEVNSREDWFEMSKDLRIDILAQGLVPRGVIAEESTLQMSDFLEMLETVEKEDTDVGRALLQFVERYRLRYSIGRKDIQLVVYYSPSPQKNILGLNISWNSPYNYTVVIDGEGNAPNWLQFHNGYDDDLKLMPIRSNN